MPTSHLPRRVVGAPGLAPSVLAAQPGGGPPTLDSSRLGVAGEAAERRQACAFPYLTGREKLGR